MIELIFVVVIIGVLAAVAIPKLSATRDDAEVAERSHNISVAASEIAAYAVSQGTIDYQIANMSNAVKSLVGKSNATVDSGIPSVDFKMGDVSDCLIFRIDDGVTDANLTLQYGTAGSDSRCLTLQSIFDASQYPIPLRGKRVKR